MQSAPLTLGITLPGSPLTGFKGPASTSASSGNSPRRVTFEDSVDSTFIDSGETAFPAVSFQDSEEVRFQDTSNDAVSDILVKLSNAVAEAQNQVEEERQRRRMLELENETMRIKIRSLSMLNPEAAAAFDAAVGAVAPGRLEVPVPVRDRAFTTADAGLADPMAVSRTASIEETLLSVEFTEPACVIAVRQIHRLGFDPSHTLAGYFSVFGVVREVIHVSGTDGAVVIMAESEAASRIMCPSGVRTINGVVVEVSPFDSSKCGEWVSRRSSAVLSPSQTASPLPTVASRSHALTWDASRPHASSNMSALGDGEYGDSGNDDDLPRMNLLEALQVHTDADEKCVFTVRKVHKLGFKSQHALRQYFSQFGRVKDVVLLPMRAKPKPGPGGQTRGVRPSSMGFVVMHSACDVSKVMGHTSGHSVKGWPIEVRPFVKPAQRRDSRVAAGCELDRAASITAENAAMLALDS